jgi:hypothetical protein
MFRCRIAIRLGVLINLRKRTHPKKALTFRAGRWHGGGVDFAES